jgi:xylulokinase
MTAEAAEAPPGSESLLFLPYLTGERAPYPDPCARGVFFGLGLRHQKRHMIRAVLEGVAFGLRDCFDLIAGLGLEMPEVRASGGGARSLLWRQIQADVSGRAMSVINVDEGPAFGVALLAGVGAGVYADVQTACRETIRVTSTMAPVPENVALYEKQHALYVDLYKHLKDDFPRLASLT